MDCRQLSKALYDFGIVPPIHTRGSYKGVLIEQCCITLLHICSLLICSLKEWFPIICANINTRRQSLILLEVQLQTALFAMLYLIKYVNIQSCGLIAESLGVSLWSYTALCCLEQKCWTSKEAQQKSYGSFRTRLERDCKNDRWFGTPSLGGQAEKAGAILPDKRMLWENLRADFWCVKGGYKKKGTGSLAESIATGQEEIVSTGLRLDIVKKTFSL